MGSHFYISSRKSRELANFSYKNRILIKHEMSMVMTRMLLKEMGRKAGIGLEELKWLQQEQLRYSV